MRSDIFYMSSLLNADLLPELEEYRGQIEATIRPYIKIVAKPENNLGPWQSKFGGIPYLPKSAQYPKNSKGQPLFLLVQINFAEIPKLESFPKHGILQFYIGDDDQYGLQFEDMTNQENFRICYFSEVVKNEESLVTDFSFLPSPRFVPVSNSKSCSLVFELKQQPISAYDYQFEDTIFNGSFPGHREDLYPTLGSYEKIFRADGHKLGGYPYFTQSDPRGNEKYRSKDFKLLLQVDTDSNADIMWGDAGVANFFMRETDLKECVFSEVMYNWDCC
jgi:uncharacterized protein YwqG